MNSLKDCFFFESFGPLWILYVRCVCVLWWCLNLLLICCFKVFGVLLFTDYVVLGLFFSLSYSVVCYHASINPP